MADEASRGHFYLVIKPQLDGADGYLLEVYDALPTASEQPLASAGLPSLDYNRLRKLLEGIFSGEPHAQREMGNYLAEWLFMEQPVAAVQERQYNAVGAYLREHLVNTQRKLLPRVWLCLDQELLGRMEFRGYVPLECLEHNTFLPIRVVRGTVESAVPSNLLAASSEPLEVASKLRVLLVYANPDEDKAPPGSRYPHLKELHRHFDALCRTLDPLVHAGELFIEKLSNPTPEQLRGMLTRFNPHVLVFVGHGYGHKNGGLAGGLVCMRDGAPEPWAFPELVHAVKETEEPALRLVVFIACQSFAAAPSLLLAGVPAVVAMQPFARTDFLEASVSVFAKPFFSQLSHLEPITDAHAAACRALTASTFPFAAMMPTLWLATPKDHLFASPEERLRTAYLDALLGKPEVSLLPFPDVEGGVDFEKLYVAQTIVEEKKEERQSSPTTESTSPERRMESAVMQEVVKRVEVDLWEALEERHRLMVEAPAWTGKSILCRWVTQHCVAQTGWLPIFINYRDLAQSGKSIQRYLEQDYTEWLGLQDREIEIEMPDGRRKHLSVGEWLFNLWRDGQALLIIDGADEVTNKALQEQIFASLPVVPKRAHPPILLTSRPLEDARVSGFKKLELKELRPSQIESLVCRCGEVLAQKGKAEQFIEEIRQAENVCLLELLTSPGHLVHTFTTYVQEDITFTAVDNLMERLAEKRFDTVGRIRLKLDPDEPVYKQQVTEEIAFHLLFCRQGQAQDREQTLQLVSHALMAVKIHETSVYTPKDGVKMLEDLCCNSGFLKRTRGGAYEFQSVPWLQFFAACHIGRKLREDDLSFKQWIQGGIKSSQFPISYLQSQIGRASQSAMECSVCKTRLPSLSHYLRRLRGHLKIQKNSVFMRVLEDRCSEPQCLQSRMDSGHRCHIAT